MSFHNVQFMSVGFKVLLLSKLICPAKLTKPKTLALTYLLRQYPLIDVDHCRYMLFPPTYGRTVHSSRKQ